jgi:hypothetical protein
MIAMMQVFSSTSKKKLFCHESCPKKLKRLQRHDDGLMKKQRMSRNAATSYVFIIALWWTTVE